MQLRTGTSGFSYKEWKGPFYPEKLPASRFLEHYASRLDTVEINNTFYRMPKAEMLEGWAAKVPDTFRFVLKASQRITHHRKLVETADAGDFLWRTSEALGERRGPFLFQLPPYLHKDVDVLRRFLDELPGGCRAAFEFRHASWVDDEVHEALRQAGQVLCHAEVDADQEDGGDGDAPLPELVATADWGYLRLRRAHYDDDDLDAWAAHLRAQPWSEAYVFFKHEDEGAAPRLALALAERFAAG